MITYLYHKRHLKTDLNYFGKTINDPYSYNGSGIYWKEHLKVHGKEIETVQVWKFNDITECSKFAIEFSVANNIVESDKWANLILEDGLGGGQPKGKPKTEAHRNALKAARKSRLPFSEESRLKMSASGKKPKKIATCPHCGIVGGQNQLTRYHFNNCKSSQS